MSENGMNPAQEAIDELRAIKRYANKGDLAEDSLPGF